MLHGAPQVSGLLSKTLMQVVDELLSGWLGFGLEMQGREAALSTVDVGCICARCDFFEVLF